jgi:hypothetical protein
MKLFIRYWKTDQEKSEVVDPVHVAGGGGYQAVSGRPGQS